VTEPLKTAFDYGQLEPEVRTVAVEAAAKIRLLGRQATESIVAIGEELSKVKERLPHGAWLPWIKAEFGWPERQAQRLMRVHAAFKSDKLSDLAPIDVSALYLLAAPKTPPEVRDMAMAKAAAGERVTHGFVKEQLAHLPPRDPRQRDIEDEPKQPWVVRQREHPWTG
jgi:hypothetical protein